MRARVVDHHPETPFHTVSPDDSRSHLLGTRVNRLQWHLAYVWEYTQLGEHAHPVGDAPQLGYLAVLHPKHDHGTPLGVPLRGLWHPRVRPCVGAGHPHLRYHVVFFAHEPFYGSGQLWEGDEEHADALGHTPGSFRLGEYDLVVVHDVVGYELVDDLDLLVVEDLFE